ncbi:MAG: HAD family hydrolase [Eubacterium sp.]|nr:HAD family hydrolase [Eubacterium sp.]
MVLFCTDLDQTLIYSYKHDIGQNRQCVEVYQGREVSFMTQETFRLLGKLKERACIVPVTTRSIEQYGRIALGIGSLPYALVCNGGVLLLHGEKEKAWYEKSLELAQESRAELKAARRILELEADRTLEVRLVEGLFLFTKCRNPQQTVARLEQELYAQEEKGGTKQELHPRTVQVFRNGEKVYAVPRGLNKGAAVARLRELVGAKAVFAAGDSAFDLPMLAQADFAAAPPGCGWEGLPQCAHVREMPGRKVFSEELLEAALDQVAWISSS